MTRSPLLFFLAAIGLCTDVLLPRAGAADAAPDKVRFNRDIRPIFSDTCFHCHGFDAKARKAGLRLDIREEALKKTENDVYPIVPGKPEESEIIARLYTKDEDDIMPPVKAHKEITPEQKELIKRWVAEGRPVECFGAVLLRQNHSAVRKILSGRDRGALRERRAAVRFAGHCAAGGGGGCAVGGAE